MLLEQELKKNFILLKFKKKIMRLENKYGIVFSVLYVNADSISDEFFKDVRNNISPSMTSNDEETSQYPIDFLMDYYENMKDIFPKEFEMLDYCVKNKIEYIEF